MTRPLTFAESHCKYFWFFLILLSLLNVGRSWGEESWAANLQCNEERFQGQSEMINLAHSTNIERHILELSDLKMSRGALVQKLNFVPLTVDFNQKVTNSAALNSPLSKNQTDVSELTVSYDLNILSRRTQQKLIKNQIQTISSEIRSLKNRHFAEKVNAINDVVESQILDKILLERQMLVDKKIQYYKSLRDFGELNSEEISLAQSEFIELNDKILANKIKRNERLFFLGVDKVSTDLDTVMFMSLPTKLTDNCSYQTESVKQIELAVAALETNLEIKDIDHQINLLASASISHSRVRGVYTDELSAGISISIPLYDGGVIDAERNEIIDKISIEKRRLHYAKATELSELAQRKNTEEVIIASLESLLKKASSDLSRYHELEKRLEMGESVFIEKSNKRKEYLETLEAFLRLKYDMMEGWFEFLGRLNGFSKV